MDLVLCIKCWVFLFMLKMPHLLLITVILVSLILDEYLSITFLPWLLIKYRHSGPNPARFPTCLTRWLSTLQDQPAQVRLFTTVCPSLATTHTTSSPKCPVSTLVQAGRYPSSVLCHLPYCINSQGSWVSFSETGGEETYPLLYFS